MGEDVDVVVYRQGPGNFGASGSGVIPAGEGVAFPDGIGEPVQRISGGYSDRVDGTASLGVERNGILGYPPGVDRSIAGYGEGPCYHRAAGYGRRVVPVVKGESGFCGVRRAVYLRPRDYGLGNEGASAGGVKRYRTERDFCGNHWAKMVILPFTDRGQAITDPPTAAVASYQLSKINPSLTGFAGRFIEEPAITLWGTKSAAVPPAVPTALAETAEASLEKLRLLGFFGKVYGAGLPGGSDCSGWKRKAELLLPRLGV